MPQHAQLGDQVVMLFGGATPFVVRGVENGARDEEGGNGSGGGSESGAGDEDGVHKQRDKRRRRKLIGEAYVHGMMDGEAMEGLEMDPKSKKPNRTEVFVLI